jgi:hypothetical protein
MRICRMILWPGKWRRHSVFTVRSAYYIEWSHIHGGRLTRPDGLGQSSHNLVWEILWKLKVPSKIKIIIWWSLHGIIPGYVILANRHIPLLGQCSVRSQGAEDILHLIFTCRRAKKCGRRFGCWKLLSQFWLWKIGIGGLRRNLAQ